MGLSSHVLLPQLKELYLQGFRPEEVVSKRDGSVQTTTDIRIGELVSQFYAQQGYTVINEESPDSHDCILLPTGRYCIVDPIDGTRAWVAQKGVGGSLGTDFGTQFTLIENGKLVQTYGFLPTQHAEIFISGDWLSIRRELLGTEQTKLCLPNEYESGALNWMALFNQKYLVEFPWLDVLQQHVGFHSNPQSITQTIYLMAVNFNVNLVIQKGMIWDLMPLLHAGLALGYTAYCLKTLRPWEFSTWQNCSEVQPTLMLIRSDEVDTLIEQMGHSRQVHDTMNATRL